VHHVHGNVDPKRDIEIIQTELILADLDSLQRRIHENDKKARSNSKEAEALQEIYENLRVALESGKLASEAGLEAEQLALLQDLPLLTLKPFLYALNVAEGDIAMEDTKIREILGVGANVPAVAFSGKMELDMLGFSAEERKEYLAEFGLNESPTDVLIRIAYDLLGLQYFFTAGEIEVRAWTVHKGAKAPEAAGVIHTDFIKKFIKAEVVNWKDFVELG